MKITQPTRAALVAQNVPASGVTYVDTGGYFGGGIVTIADVLALIGAGSAPGAFLTVIGGGKGTVQDLGSVTGTATVDFANANAFLMELAGNTTVGTTGWTNLKDVQVRLAIDGGAGGFTPTISGVTWVTSAPGVIGAGETLHVVLWGNDGGTTIWGAVVGGETPTDGLVPYLIESGETFTVPIKKQALKAMPITVDAGGSLVVDGFLLEVA